MKKLFLILRNKNWFEKIMFIVAFIFTIAMILIGTIQIGWYTVFTSVAIGIVYEDIKNAIKEFKDIQIEDKEMIKENEEIK